METVRDPKDNEESARPELTGGAEGERSEAREQGDGAVHDASAEATASGGELGDDMDRSGRIAAGAGSEVPAANTVPERTDEEPGGERDDANRDDAAPSTGPATDADSSSGADSERRDPLSLLVDVIAAPVAAFKYLSKNRHVGLGLIVAFATMMTFAVAQTPSPFDDTGLEVPPLELTPATVIVMSALAIGVGLPFAAAVYHVIARLLGGRNRFVFILQSIAFAMLPNLLNAPLLAAQRLFDIGLLVQLVSAGTSIWVIVLNVIALREVYGFSTARAIATYLLPWFMGVLLFLPLVFFALGVMFGL